MTPWSTRRFIPQGSQSTNRKDKTGRHLRQRRRRIGSGSRPSFPINNGHCATTPLMPPCQEATAINPARVRSPFTTPQADPATQEAVVKAQVSVRTDQVAVPTQVGGCLSLHWRQWQAIGAEQWVVSVLREGYRILFQHRLTPPPPPSQFPGIVSNIPLRLSKSSRPASRGRDYDFEGGLGESRRPGSLLLQPLLPGGKGVRRLETRDRPLPFQRVRTTNSFKMETASSVLLSVRKGDFLASYRPERRLLPDTRSRLCQQAGGHSLRLPLLVDKATSPMDGIQQGPTGSEVPAGSIQRPGGPTQLPQPSPGCGMVASPSGSEGPTAHVGFPHFRPVRNTSQCQAASVLLP